jgi:MOSC domain-containing protein YiiM
MESVIAPITPLRPVRQARRAVCQADPVSEGVVEQIAISPEHEVLPAPVARVRVVAGQGLEGDRNFAPDGAAPGEAITLIESEALAGLRRDTGIELSHEASRRNVLTRGIDLNALVGKRFRVGEVLCEGVELCEPCNHLQKLTQPGVLRGLVHRAGLRADVLEGGTIAPGDAVRAA